MPDTYVSLLMVVSLALVAAGLLVATGYYLYRAFMYRLHEFLACCFAVFFGAASYVIAKRLGFVDLRITSRWDSLLNLFREPPFWWVLGLGLFCGFFYAHQLRQFRLSSFRLALIVLCWAHAVTLELLFSLFMDPSSSSGADVLGSVFVMALSLVSVLQIPGHRRGTVVDLEDGIDPESAENRQRPQEKAPKDDSIVDPF